MLIITMLMMKMMMMMMMMMMMIIIIIIIIVRVIVIVIFKLIIISLVGWLVGFLTSSSTTRLYRGQAPRLTSDNFSSAATHETERGDHDFCLSRSDDNKKKM